MITRKNYTRPQKEEQANNYFWSSFARGIEKTPPEPAYVGTLLNNEVLNSNQGSCYTVPDPPHPGNSRNPSQN
jgi:hypothetical protein